MEPERRQVAVLFVDMVGFTTFSQRSGEEAAFTLMQSLVALMTSAVDAQGGVVQGFTGDGIMAVFGAPVAYEDAPARACRAALAMLRALGVAGSALEAQFGVRPQVRIGMTFGPAVFGAVQGGLTVLGDTVNFAARLQTHAEPDRAVMSEAMYRLLQGLADISLVGEFSIKGRSGVEKVYRLDAMRVGAARFDAALHRGLTTYIGRDRELEALERGLDAIADGVQVIDIVGEAGIGKTRLLHEFRAQIVKQRMTALTGACTPNGRGAPFSAFIEIARGAVRISPGDDEKTIARKLSEGLQPLRLSSNENLGLLMNMLGLEPPKGAFAGLDGVLIGLRTRELLRQIICAWARLTPLILIFEDLHWIDSASEQLLASLVAIPEKLQLLILHSRRPAHAPSWSGNSRIRPLALEPLSGRETSRIAQARLGVDVMPDALAKLIASRAEGNALFAEEIASYLSDHGVVRIEAGGLLFDAATAAATAPESVQSLLASRVDQLVPSEQTLLQAAAVIGRRFDPGLVLAVTGGFGPDETRFAAMEALDLVRRDERTGDYGFKHSLLRDALYNGLLSPARGALHLKVAAELERRNANRLFEIAESLALHYSAAGSIERAFHYLAMAGDKSLNVYAVLEAERYYRDALALFEADNALAAPATVVHVVSRLLETLLLKSDYREAGVVARQFMPFLRRAGETPDLVVAYHYQALSWVQNFELSRAHDLMVEALAIAERLGDGRARAYARGGLLQCRTRLGLDSIEEAERMKARLMEDALQFGDNFIRNASYYFVSWDYFYRGLFKQARESAARLIASGHESSDPRAIGVANWILAGIDLVSGAPEAAILRADECLRVAISPFDRLQGSIIKAVANIFLGRVREGLTSVEALNVEFARLGALYSVLDGPRGVALILLGRINEGIRVIEKAITERDTIGDHTSAAFARVPLAEIYIQILTGGTRRPSMKALRENWRFLIGAKLTGARRARVLLEQAAAHKQLFAHGAILARINYNLGVLSMIKRKRVKARAYLERARDAALIQEEAAMVERIDAALAKVA